MIHLAFHPLFATFPLPVFCCAAIFEVLGSTWRPELKQVVLWLLVLAALSITCAFVSGLFASYYASQSFQVSEDSISYHYQLGKIALGIVWLTPGLRIVKERAIRFRHIFELLYFICFGVALLLVAMTGYYGARLVFVEGAGVVA